jgi:hypothetical protein
MPKPDFEQESVLEAYRAEHAALTEQIRLLTDRHRALGQIIAGLELLLETKKRAAEQAEPPVLAIFEDADALTNAVGVLRHEGRPLSAAAIVRVLEANGVSVRPNTVYKALERYARLGAVVTRVMGRFGLTEWVNSPHEQPHS